MFVFSPNTGKFHAVIIKEKKPFTIGLNVIIFSADHINYYL